MHKGGQNDPYWNYWFSSKKNRCPINEKSRIIDDTQMF